MNAWRFWIKTIKDEGKGRSLAILLRDALHILLLFIQHNHIFLKEFCEGEFLFYIQYFHQQQKKTIALPLLDHVCSNFRYAKFGLKMSILFYKGVQLRTKVSSECNVIPWDIQSKQSRLSESNSVNTGFNFWQPAKLTLIERLFE